MCFGTIVVHHCLNPGRAMMLCGIPNRASKRMLTISACPKGPTAPESIDFGTITLPRKPTIYINTNRNSTWETTPYKKEIILLITAPLIFLVNDYPTVKRQYGPPNL